IDHRRIMSECLEAMGLMLCDQGQAERAASLLAAAAGVREATGRPLRPTQQPALDRAVATLPAALGDAAVALAWEAGRASPLDQAIAKIVQGEQGEQG